MKIEVGKTYKDLVGNVSTIMSERHPDVFVNHHGQLFNGWGRALPVRHAANSFDLVAEVNAQGGSAHEADLRTPPDLKAAGYRIEYGVPENRGSLRYWWTWTKDGRGIETSADDWGLLDEAIDDARAEMHAHEPPPGANIEVQPPASVQDYVENHALVRDPIPHADLIRAVLDGKEVQCRQWKHRGEPPTVPGFEYVDCIAATSDWLGTPRTPTSVAQAAIDLMVNNPRDYQFRLKPETVVQWCVIWPNGGVSEGYHSKLALNQTMNDNGAQSYTKVLRLELDPDTLEVISAKTEAP